MNHIKSVITDTSGYAAKLLGTRTHGIIHSVYRKTINLSLDGRLIALQASGSPLSPISLITDLSAEDMNGLSLSAGSPVTITQTTIEAGSTASFCFSHPHIRNLGLSASLDAGQIDTLESQIFPALSARNAGSFDLLFTDPERASGILFLTAARERFSEANRHLTSGKFKDAALVLCRLIGLGIGLTPGGDDFLCGMLAGLTLCGLAQHPFALLLREQIAAHLSDTNEISAAFLCCALDNQFSLAVNSLSALPPAGEILASFGEIGHSSGTDTLSGIFYVIRIRHFLQQ